MKRSKASQMRQERAIEEKQTLLKNVEQVGTLRMTTLPHPKDVLISAGKRRGSLRESDSLRKRAVYAASG